MRPTLTTGAMPRWATRRRHCGTLNQSSGAAGVSAAAEVVAQGTRSNSTAAGAETF